MCTMRSVGLLTLLVLYSCQGRSDHGTKGQESKSSLIAARIKADLDAYDILVVKLLMIDLCETLEAPNTALVKARIIPSKILADGQINTYAKDFKCAEVRLMNGNVMRYS